jgi:DNA polymerase V
LEESTYCKENVYSGKIRGIDKWNKRSVLTEERGIRMDYSQFPKKTILCIDMKSFYASCSAVEMGLDPLTCYLAVVGDVERQGSVVLAASPALKKEFGIRTGSRLFEIPNDKRIHIVNAKMSSYLRQSMEITRLFHRYVPSECIHTYSVGVRGV